MESISVYYKPLNLFGGIQYYHETLVYTDSNNVQHLATSYTTTEPPGLPLSEAAAAVKLGLNSPYGTLTTQVANVSDLSTQQQQRWLGTSQNPFDHQPLVT